MVDTYLRPAVYGSTAALEITAHHVGGEPITFAEAYAAAYEPFPVGGEWGGAWDTTWFHLIGAVPREWAGQEVVIRLDLGLGNWPGQGGEGLLWKDGVPQQGISAFHNDFPVASAAAGGEQVDLFLEAAANPPPGRFMAVGSWPVLGPDFDGPKLYRLHEASLAVFNRPVWDLVQDLRVLLGLVDSLPRTEPRSGEVERAVEACFAALDLSDPLATCEAAREPLLHALSKPAARGHRVSAMGHAHIDTAWLWPLRETPRKAARTFSTALRLMDEYPDYRFLASQPQQYQWIRDQYPELFERIRRRVKEDRFEPVGAMWVESDCNIPSGESLVRQLLYGKRFFMEEFGVEPREVWLPDVFGYAAQLPQIMREAGCEWFLTQKMSWNDTNRFPHSTFDWEALDGSRVLAHFPPTDTYIGNFDIGELRRGVENFAQHGVSDRSLYLFGWGDGGGGPTREMLESAKRVRDLDGVPPVTIEKASDFFAAVDAERADVPVWVGELYFEFHRGTYTTQAAAKKGNRRSEVLLHDAELLACVAREDYPRAELEGAWKKVLLNQFHDIIPGSGIQWVYDDAAASYAEVADTAASVIDAAANSLFGGEGDSVVIVNTTSHDRREVVVLDSALAEAAPEGGQRLSDGSVAFIADVPALGFAISTGTVPVEMAEVEAGEGWLENGLLRVELDADGLLSRVWDKHAGRDVLAPGTRGNLLQLFHDYPPQYDAWDIDPSYKLRYDDLTAVESIEVIERGPVRAAVRVRRSFGESAQSTITQTIVLDAGSPVVRFDTEVDWRERHRLLKAAFPLAVRSPRASYEVQFGHVDRPTHQNTSWDEAKFEVCAQRWADISEAGYGVAVLNDCKYGHDAVGNVLRVSLLRGSTAPDPDADIGVHHFSYGLYPHAGGLAEGGVVERGLAFNYPLLAFGGTSAQGTGQWFSLDGPGVVLDTVKLAEDRDDAVVVRLYESLGGRGEATLSTALPVKSAALADLLERDKSPLDVVDNAVRFPIEPFQIKTVVLELA